METQTHSRTLTVEQVAGGIPPCGFRPLLCGSRVQVFAVSSEGNQRWPLKKARTTQAEGGAGGDTD
eukprot:12556999-Alexandrium_andersonii.AAC.1